MSDLVKLKEKSNNLKALIVEDSLTIQKQMKIFLEKLFEKVYVASDGEEGLSIVERVNPHIILTDLQMPKMDGYEFIKNIKETDNKSQIIVFSAYGHSENVMKFLRMGVNDFLQKPVNFKQLTNSLINAVDKLTNENKDEDKHFENTFLEDLRIIKEAKASIQLINHYKGLPLIHDGYISSITENSITIQTQTIQVKAILKEASTVIETDKYILQATLKNYDSKNKELVFENLKSIERSPRNREVLRVSPGKDFTTTIFSSTERYSVKTNSLSTKSLSFEIKFFDEKLKVEDNVNIIMGFSTVYSSSYHNTLMHKDRIDCKAKVYKIEKKDNSITKIVLNLELNISNKKILEKYIYQREVEIIKEFKQLSFNI